ncbi:hypothetical protein F0562_013587 [Nyssa sinensis]|uniref:Glucan endo-1,3-beta-D-glucosidase n=1 Tax=Nyssa sinensis TaxID=561372 RepID=A0A5J4ZQI1_9ASTE|nr:hypothetical protein F0562_013587 [Nyssa sinensis]
MLSPTLTVMFKYVSAGSEVIPGPLATYVLGAMQNLASALKAANAQVPATKTVVYDNGLHYSNLFDAMVDSVFAALEKVQASTVDIVVSETGWPSVGNGNFRNITNAQTYVNNLIAHVSSGSGTPGRTGKDLETYLFVLFNEDQKAAGAEQNFGLYYPNMTEVYHVNFPA